jgi:hypothetical protein
MTVDNKYREHAVFGQLDRYADFYKNLSFSVIGMRTPGSSPICGIDTYVYSAIRGTLESIRQILFVGRINDSYALLRKYYDSAIINVYSNLYLEDHFSLDNFVVKKIDAWVQGKEKLPRYGEMATYIRTSKKLAEINNLLYKEGDQTYSRLRERCNDHTHYNFFRTVLLNDKQVYVGDRLAVLDGFSRDLQNIFILHLSYVFHLNGHYMRSSDYLDNLECGLKPEEGSEYFVAPFVQDIFDSVLKKHRMDIAEAIRKSTAMKLE